MTVTETSVSVGRKPALWRHLVQNADPWNEAFIEGYADGVWGDRLSEHHKGIISYFRLRHGFQCKHAPFLTAGETNHKLDGASVYTMGRTLAHADLSEYEACTFRGECTDPCVVGNGNGRYASTQRAWLWRTDLLATHPDVAGYVEGWELGRAVSKHGKILFRPDVNSDTRPWKWAWEYSTPSFRRRVTVYGYSKDPSILGCADGMRANNFHYAYSWNERSNLERVRAHLAEGGNVAVVTSRRKGQEPNRRALRLMFGDRVSVADADATDEWMLARRKHGIVGDLSAKGKARQLIGTSAFVLCTH